MHGGSAPQVRKKAALRMLAMMDVALAQHQRILAKMDTTDGDRLKAIQLLYDRTGFGPGSKVEVEERKWEGVVGKVIRPTGERTRSRYADRHYEQEED